VPGNEPFTAAVQLRQQFAIPPSQKRGTKCEARKSLLGTEMKNANGTLLGESLV
jgi:hypothetical protein